MCKLAEEVLKSAVLAVWGWSTEACAGSNKVKTFITVSKQPNYIQWWLYCSFFKVANQVVQALLTQKVYILYFSSYFHGNNLKYFHLLYNTITLWHLVLLDVSYIWCKLMMMCFFYFFLRFPTHFTCLFWTQDLREECLKLRTRVFDLEQQNRALSVLFQQRIKPASDLLLQVGGPLRTQPDVHTFKWQLTFMVVKYIPWKNWRIVELLTSSIFFWWKYPHKETVCSCQWVGSLL